MSNLYESYRNKNKTIVSRQPTEQKLKTSCLCSESLEVEVKNIVNKVSVIRRTSSTRLEPGCDNFIWGKIVKNTVIPRGSRQLNGHCFFLPDDHRALISAYSPVI